MESAQAAGAGVDLRQETDEDLLVYMTMRRDDPSAANVAWAEFYTRHLEYLYRVCCRLTKGILDESGSRDLAQATFIRAYEKAITFDGEGITDPDRLQRRTRAWLGRIALNIFRDMLRGRAGVREVPLDDEELRSEPEQIRPPNSVSVNRGLLDDAIDSLSDKEQRVLRTTPVLPTRQEESAFTKRCRGGFSEIAGNDLRECTPDTKPCSPEDQATNKIKNGVRE